MADFVPIRNAYEKAITQGQSGRETSALPPSLRTDTELMTSRVK